jgi:7,8-dihydro-6-hydroxymethylpterin-pyrophosphokinase
LLDACKRVEREVGRAPGGVRHGPRVIDVDLLVLGDLVRDSASPRLTLPHPELLARRFVLVPLLELDPTVIAPGSGARLADALAALGGGQDVRLVAPPLGLPGY